MRIGQLLDGFVHDLDNLAISRYDRFSILSYPKHTLRGCLRLCFTNFSGHQPDHRPVDNGLSMRLFNFIIFG